jgi:hypothetical protein
MEIIEMVKALFRGIAIIALISSAIWFVLVVVTTLQAQ